MSLLENVKTKTIIPDILNVIQATNKNQTYVGR